MGAKKVNLNGRKYTIYKALNQKISSLGLD